MYAFCIYHYTCGFDYDPDGNYIDLWLPMADRLVAGGLPWFCNRLAFILAEFPFYTRLRDMAEQVPLLVKFVFPGRVPVKLVFNASSDGTGRRADWLLDGDVKVCTGWSSRSGLHWERCYEVVGERMVEVVGAYKLVEQVLYVRPYGSPMDRREGKNAVIVDFRELSEKLVKEVARALDIREEHMAPPTTLLALSTHDVIELWWALRYDLLATGDLTINQANLEIYKINDVFDWRGHERGMSVFAATRKAGIELEHDFDNTIILSSHTVLFERHVYYARAGFATRRLIVRATLVEVDTSQKATIIHPEHGKMEIVLEPGEYLFLHTSYNDHIMD